MGCAGFEGVREGLAKWRGACEGRHGTSVWAGICLPGSQYYWRVPSCIPGCAPLRIAVRCCVWPMLLICLTGSGKQVHASLHSCLLAQLKDSRKDCASLVLLNFGCTCHCMCFAQCFSAQSKHWSVASLKSSFYVIVQLLSTIWQKYKVLYDEVHYRDTCMN